MMVCQRCSSHTSVRAFNSEVAIHFPVREGLTKPAILVFPRMNICLECGFTEYVVPDRELRMLASGNAAEPPATIQKS